MEETEVALEEKMCQTEQPSSQKGGLRTMPFIIANEAFEKVASYGIMPNMIIYLMREYNMDSVTGASVLYLWSALTNFMPMLGAVLSECYLGRYRIIALGSIVSLLGMILIWLTAMVPQARPPPCMPSLENCKSPTLAQLMILYSSFVLMSIGAGGIRSSSMAFGADQLDQRENPHKKRVLQSYFSLYYASTTLAILIAMTVIVYIQENMGWKIGFGVPAILMFLSAFLFLLASSSYAKMKPKKNLLTGFAQVLLVAFKNRHLSFPPINSNGWYHHDKSSTLVAPTDKLRCLNKACIIRNPEEYLNPDRLASKPWGLCTVEQVEELKSLIKLIPLWSTGIMISVTFSQGSFGLLQANSMDRHLTKNFLIPAGSFGMFTILALVIWIGIYDRILVPLISKIIGKPFNLSSVKRMGIGLVLSCMAMTVSAIVEIIRQKTAIQQGFIEDPNAVVDMSALWLVPINVVAGVAEAFNAVGQNEFYYSQLPKSMSSFAAALFSLGLAVANLIASFMVTIIDDITKIEGKESWFASNINKGHYDYYYWLLAFLSLLNIFYFLFCYKAYGPCEEESAEISYEVKGKRNAQLH